MWYKRLKTFSKSIGAILLLSLLVSLPIWGLTQEETKELTQIFNSLEISLAHINSSISNLQIQSKNLNNDLLASKQQVQKHENNITELNKTLNKQEMTLYELENGLTLLSNTPQELTALQESYNKNQLSLQKQLKSLDSSLKRMQRKQKFTEAVAWVAVTCIALDLFVVPAIKKALN